MPVVRDLSLHVAAGEVVALLGPNGAGKTTTLSTIAGLLASLDGRVTLDGEDLAGVPTHMLARRGVSLVPEGRSLFFGITVREHLLLASAPGDPRRERLLELLPELSNAWIARPACSRAASSRCWPSAARWSARPASCSSTR